MIVKGMRYEPIPQQIPFSLAENQQAIVMPVGDVHYMSREWPEQKFRDHLQWGMDRGAFFLGMGEYLDFASYSQRKQAGPMRDDVKSQIDDMIKEKAEDLFRIMEPTKGRWLGLIEGDHRWTFQDATGVDQYLAGLLGTDFLGWAGYLRLHSSNGPTNHPEADTIIYACHGMGTARLTGSHLHRVEDLMLFIDADIYLMGHSHAKIGAPIDKQYVTPDGIHAHRTQIIARTGGFLKGYVSSAPLALDEPAFMSRATYVEERSYTPSAMGGLCFGVGYEQIKDSKYYRPTIHLSI